MGENAYVLGRASAISGQKFGSKEFEVFANKNNPALQSEAVYLLGLLAICRLAKAKTLANHIR